MNYTAPAWAKIVAGVMALAALAAVSSFNVGPSFARGANWLAVTQIMFATFLAAIPFVYGWDAKTKIFLTVVFMLGGGLFAFENSLHRHDGEKTVNGQHAARVAERDTKKASREALGKVEPTSEFQIEAAKKAVEIAEKNKYGVKAAQDKLQEISALLSRAKEAEKLDARIDELEKELGKDKYVSDTSSSEAVETAKSAWNAFLIELGNRFIPEAFFKVSLAALALLFPAKPATQGMEMEISSESAPTPPRKRAKSAGTGNAKPVGNGEGAVILPFQRRKPEREEVLKLRGEGKTFEEIGALFGYTGRHMRNIANDVSGKGKRQMRVAAA